MLFFVKYDDKPNIFVRKNIQLKTFLFLGSYNIYTVYNKNIN